MRAIAIVCLVSTIILLTACGGGRCGDAKGACPTEAIAVLQPTKGNAVAGTVRFSQQGDDTLLIVAEVSGLSANGQHAFHVHEFGDASAPDAESAGGHYNPEGHAHGGPDSEERHAGDFGNLQADAQGKARLELTARGVTVCGRNPVLGRSIIIHAKADDLSTQPSGNAGPRIAIGVIGVAKAP
ncbi:MAG TPA: superoxide dismutase family protein [Planctomycetota bacterium]|nr:superoxide dismutase family protein [Planctomycetota bacterium]